MTRSESGPLLPADPIGWSVRGRHAERAWPVSVTGLGLVVAGAVAQTVALAASPWVARTGPLPVRLGFSDLAAYTQRGFAYAYFGYVGWILVGLTLGLGVAAALRWSGSNVFAVLGAIAGVAGAFASIAAVLVLAWQADSDVFRMAGSYALGVYLVVLGLVATAFGSVVGGVSR